jgi:serine/threonine protein kinase
MINTTIGKYKITRLIGEGGMASVYEAEHEMLGTKVAIKVLNPILSANAQIRERFKNEAKMMASFNHSNITKIMDFDDQPHQLSIVMEFLEGEDLNEKIKRSGPLSQDTIKDIFVQTLSAFQYAHEKGVVHRDIKPSNIYVLPNGHVKILDFGIAKLFGQGNEMTQTGTQMGTPIYMSPEQVKADKSIDHRSDIYSLGVTMFYAINGKPPYNSDIDSQFDIFNKIVYEPLPEFSAQNNLRFIVSKACQKNRDERFQTCFEFLQAFSLPSLNPESNEKTIIDEKFANNKQEENTILTVSSLNSNQNIENSNFPNTAKNKNNKRNRILIITALALVILGVWSYFYFNNKTTYEKNNSVDSLTRNKQDSITVTKNKDSQLGNVGGHNDGSGTVTKKEAKNKDSGTVTKKEAKNKDSGTFTKNKDPKEQGIKKGNMVDSEPNNNKVERFPSPVLYTKTISKSGGLLAVGLDPSYSMNVTFTILGVEIDGQSCKGNIVPAVMLRRIRPGEKVVVTIIVSNNKTGFVESINGVLIVK